MKRERLQKLFSEDKEIFQGGMLFPTWICKENWQSLAVLARKGMIDVIVVSRLSRLSYCPKEILQTMEMLQSF